MEVTCLILPFRFSRFQACFRQRPPPYRPPSLRCGCPGGQSGHSVLQDRGQPWAHHPVAQKWPTSWHGQDGCAVTAYRFARRKFVLLQRCPWPKESVPWSGVRLCGSQQCRGRDEQKCLSSYSRFESWQSVMLSNIKGIVHLKINILSIFTLMLFRTFLLWIMKEHIFNNVVHTMKVNRVQNNLDVSSHVNSPVWGRQTLITMSDPSWPTEGTRGWGSLLRWFMRLLEIRCQSLPSCLKQTEH